MQVSYRQFSRNQVSNANSHLKFRWLAHRRKLIKLSSVAQMQHQLIVIFLNGELTESRSDGIEVVEF